MNVEERAQIQEYIEEYGVLAVLDAIREWAMENGDKRTMAVMVAAERRLQ